MLNLRDNTQYKEIIEMKKVYKHPLYEYPSLYNDVAVIELGRRIEYDFDKYGDSPTCMARPEQPEIEGKIATVQVNKVKISKTWKYCSIFEIKKLYLLYKISLSGINRILFLLGLWSDREWYKRVFVGSKCNSYLQ